MENKTVYELDGVSYSYLGKFEALRQVSIKIDKGERVALLGANGSGKSTLLMIMAALIYPQGEGVMKFFGEEVKEESFLKRSFRKDFRGKVGIVFQNSDTQLFNSSVEDELIFGPNQLGLSQDVIKGRVERYSSMMGLDGLMGRHPQNLSVGEKKRVAIASILAMEPQVMLLDEPTAGLDPRTIRHLIEGIGYFCEKGATVITATQDIHMVREIATRVIVMGEDKAVARDGSADEVLQDAAFLEKHNLVHAHAHKHKGTVHTHPHEHPTHDHPHL